MGHRSILAWGAEVGVGVGKLSDEGVTITGIEGEVVRGVGWELMTDSETGFAVDLRTGRRVV